MHALYVMCIYSNLPVKSLLTNITSSFSAQNVMRKCHCQHIKKYQIQKISNDKQTIARMFTNRYQQFAKHQIDEVQINLFRHLKIPFV